MSSSPTAAMAPCSSTGSPRPPLSWHGQPRRPWPKGLTAPACRACRGQYHLVMKYLSEMTDEQTLVMYSGHPLGYAAAAAVARQSPMTVLTRALGWARGTQALPQHQRFAARGDHQRHGDPQLLLEGPIREDARTGRHHVRPN